MRLGYLFFSQNGQNYGCLPITHDAVSMTVQFVLPVAAGNKTLNMHLWNNKMWITHDRLEISLTPVGQITVGVIE